MKMLICGLFFCIAVSGSSQDYKTSLIPDSLKLGANAVKRFEELHVIIKGIDKAIVKHRYAITILNENGDEFAYYNNFYSNLISLNDISGRLFDAEGKLLKSIHKKDISDMSATDDASLLTDARNKKYTFYNKSYPYTVEFEDEQDYNGIFYLPAWLPVEDEKFSVQQSRFVVDVPSADYQLRYRQFIYSLEPTITGNKPVTYVWEIKNQKPVIFEEFQPDFRQIIPAVYIAPSDFSIGSFKGNMNTWKGLGQFIFALNNKRDELPENIKSDIYKLTDGIIDRMEKIKILYGYLQKHTRYISIQLGIGSWQPFEAKYVAEKKYGDCKALSNYMVSILKEAGIKAHYVLITAGEGKAGLMEDFPSAYFNHAICCVPNGKDTLWLECTSQTKAAGFMGSFTGDRKALMIDDDGGHVVSTPSYQAEDNQQLRKVKATVDAAGNMTAEVNTHFTGIQQELQHSLIHDATIEERKKYLNRALSLPTYIVDKSDYKETSGIIPSVDEFLHVEASNYATVSGKRMFITPNLFNRSVTKLTEEKERKYPIRFSLSFRDIDTLYFSVPPGYILEARPKDVSLNNQFGKYTISYKIDNDKIEVIRSEVGQRQVFPASDYPDLVKYFDAIYKADHSRIVLVKKEG